MYINKKCREPKKWGGLENIDARYIFYQNTIKDKGGQWMGRKNYKINGIRYPCIYN